MRRRASRWGLGGSSYGLPEVRPYGSWFEQRILNPIWTGVSMPALVDVLPAAGRDAERRNDREPRAGSDAGAVGDAAPENLLLMRRHVEAGGKLSEAMGMFPQVFRPLHRFLVEAAEGTGALDGAFLRLSAYVDADYELRRVIKKETFMPKINLVATFLLPPLYVLIVSGTQAYLHTAVLPLLKPVRRSAGGVHRRPLRVDDRARRRAVRYGQIVSAVFRDDRADAVQCEVRPRLVGALYGRRFDPYRRENGVQGVRERLS